MASETIDEIIERHSMLQSLSTSDLEDSLERNICHTQAMQAQIAHEMSKIQGEPTQQARLKQQAANLGDLQVKDQQLTGIMEEEMTHYKQVSVLSCMHLLQAEEVKAKSQEIRCYQIRWKNSVTNTRMYLPQVHWGINQTLIWSQLTVCWV